MAQTVDDYILRTQGEEEMKRLAQAVEQARQSLVQSINTSGAASAAARQHAQALQSLEDQYNQAAAAASRLQNATDRARRANAASQLGFGAVNMAQDVIQGGNPAFALNNAIFLAQQQGVRQLGSEMIAAAGGAAVLGGAFASVAVAAGAAFLVIDSELKQAKLGWEDLGSVVSNLSPWLALKETVAGIGEVAGQMQLTNAIETAWDATGGFYVDLAKVAVGWDSATEAARKHKEETEQAAAAAKELAEANARLKQFRSDEQQESDSRGKLVGKALADMGGEGGIDSVRDRLAGAMSANGGDEKITRNGVTKTRREWAQEDTSRLMAKASSGDEQATGQLRQMLANQGYDLEGFDAASKEGIDLEKLQQEQKSNELKGRKEARKYSLDLEKKAREEQEREEQRVLDENERENERRTNATAQKRKQRTGQAAGNLQSQFNEDIAFGRPVNQREIASRLESSQGMDAATAQEYSGKVLTELQKGFSAEIRKRAGAMGISESEATALFRQEQIDKRTDAGMGLADSGLNVLSAQANLRESLMGKAPERIAATDFAAKVESGGADVGKEQINIARQQLDVLKAINDYNRNARSVALMGP